MRSSHDVFANTLDQTFIRHAEGDGIDVTLRFVLGGKRVSVEVDIHPLFQPEVMDTVVPVRLFVELLEF